MTLHILNFVVAFEQPNFSFVSDHPSLNVNGRIAAERGVWPKNLPGSTSLFMELVRKAGVGHCNVVVARTRRSR
jgi:hypothetical protein